MMNSKLNITKAFVKFLKEEKIYNDFMYMFSQYRFFYDGVFDNIYTKRGENNDLLNDWSIKNALGRICGASIGMIKDKWDKFLCENNLNLKELNKPNEKYFNIITPVVINFLIENNALKEFTQVLYDRGRIEECVIKDNDIDKILRKYQRSTVNLISDSDMFCNWDDYEDCEPEHIKWYELEDKFCDLIRENIHLDVIP